MCCSPLLSPTLCREPALQEAQCCWETDHQGTEAPSESLSSAYTPGATAPGCCLPKLTLVLNLPEQNGSLSFYLEWNPSVHLPSGLVALQRHGRAFILHSPRCSPCLPWPSYSWLCSVTRRKHLPGHAHVPPSVPVTNSRRAFEAPGSNSQNSIGVLSWNTENSVCTSVLGKGSFIWS